MGKNKKKNNHKNNSTLKNKGKLNVSSDVDKFKQMDDEVVEENIKNEVEDDVLGSVDNEENFGIKSLIINVPKKEGKGEDADPISFFTVDLCVTGVFDGMGGAGATEYTNKNGTHTGAYIASREVKKICEEFIKQNMDSEFNIDVLKQAIQKGLDKTCEVWDIKPSGLRSSMIRVLPTTLAMIYAKRKEKGVHVMSYWSGDSRNYILAKNGLKQVSVDELVSAQDPLENLRNDAALSNCISQDRKFEITTKDCGVFFEPIIIISATDGCFGYLKSPIHFEYLLLNTLINSNNIEDWKLEIINNLKDVSGDDFSISIMFVENDFTYWKSIMKERFDFIKKLYIDPIDMLEQELYDTKNRISQLEEALYDKVSESWYEYKKEYMNDNN
ncbi:MAG: hypothetical protein J6J11_04640 [Treponema sp.]|nr:hypothetical protein [Treponema sp.]